MTDDDLVPPDTSSLEARICRLLQLTGPCASGLLLLDVGGGTGVHAELLVADGYEVELLDPVPTKPRGRSIYLSTSSAREYQVERQVYEENLPTEEQIACWFKHDVAVIVDRALTRLGMVMEELRNTGRITDPLVIVGPANPPKTELVRHHRVGEGYIASRYTVFVVCMADQKLGAYRTSLDSITGAREPEEQTSEYRYRDIVSVNVKTIRLDLPPGAQKTEDAEPTYAFVDAQEKNTVAERFTLVVPGDRFTVTTKVSTEDGTGSRIDFSKADRALAAIRRRVAASTGLNY